MHESKQWRAARASPQGDCARTRTPKCRQEGAHRERCAHGTRATDSQDLCFGISRHTKLVDKTSRSPTLQTALLSR